MLTIDNKHAQVSAKLLEIRTKQIPKLKMEIKKIHSKLSQTDDPMRRIEMNERLGEIQREIKTLKRNEKDYLLTNSSVIHDYFESKKNIGSVEANTTTTVLDNFFHVGASEAKHTNDAKCAPTKRSKVDQYFANVDERFLDMNNYVYSKDVCQNCNRGELILVAQEGLLVCDRCSSSFPYIIDNDKPSYKEPPKEVCFYAYKRINHFREVLAQFQAKESTQIPEEIIERIRTQIKKERLTLQQLDNKRVKEILKKMGYNKYYEHIPFIKDKLGIKPPVMSPQLEETLCSMFMKIQAPYAKYCPSNRTNFLNYYYTVYKLCELLDQRQFLEYFSMLKDREKRIEQDNIWRNICHELEWEFIPTV